MTYQYSIYRNATLIATVTPKGTHQEAIQAIDVANMSFTLTEYIEFLKGDTTIINGNTYTANTPAPFTQSTQGWEYELQFLSEGYGLGAIQMLALDDTNELTEYDCFLTGDANACMDLILANANRISSGWTKGVVDATETLDFDFTGDFCNTALAKIADAFKTEFWYSGKVVNMTKSGADSGLSFRHGKGLGLTKLSRKNTNTKVVTRLHIYGSKQNLPTTYPGLSKRLRMPDRQLYIEDPVKVALYGLVEDSKIFEDIFPKRIGTVTSVGSELVFTDSAMDFDINLQLVDGVSAKVKFISGQCGGYIFEIKTYVAGSKTYTLLVNKDETALTVPSTAIKPAIGDKYILLDVIMPAIDITNAEIALKVAGQAAYDLTSDPIVNFDAVLDRRFLRDNNVTVTLGDFVNIAVTEAGIDKDIRIVSKETDLQDPHNITIELADTTSVANIVVQAMNSATIQKALGRAKITDIARQRLNWRSTSELATMLETLRTEMLLVMVEGGAYVTDIVVETNSGNNPNGFTTTAGQVIQQEYIDNGGVWDVASCAVTLATSAPYYAYIRASRVSVAATVVTSLTKIGVEDDPAFYHFPLGIISSIIDGGRMFSSIQGYTKITGNNVTTGRVQDVTGQNYLDLDTGEFNLGDATKGIDWGVTEEDGLTIRGFAIADSVIVGSPTSNAGISGVTESGASSIRFYAGSTFADRNTADFRVQDDGKVYMSNAVVSGTIDALEGSIADFSIDGTGLTNTTGTAFVNIRKTVGSAEIGVSIGVGIPTPIFGSSTTNAVGVFVNTIYNAGLNAGIIVDVTGGGNSASNVIQNVAIDIRRGSLFLEQGAYILATDENNQSNIGIGVTFTQDIGGGYAMKFIKGIYIGTVAI